MAFNDEFLAHHGIPGMKWYNRRFQNKDGSLTEEGKKRYGVGDSEDSKKQKYNSETSKYQKDPQTLTDAELNKRLERMRKENEYKNLRNSLVPPTRSEKRKAFWHKVLTDATSKMIADITKEVSKTTVSFIFKKGNERSSARRTGNQNNTGS